MAEYNPSMDEIGLYVKKHIREWVSPIIQEFSKNKDQQQTERLIRLEEELKGQRELIKQDIQLSEKRFEDLHRTLDQRCSDIQDQMDRRFTDMDRRFTEMQKSSERRFADLQRNSDQRFEGMEKRFEQVDKRFEQVDKRFEQVDKRFEQVDKRFEQVEKRFEQVDKRFEQVDKRFSFMQWLIGIGFTLIVVLMSIYQFIS